MSGILGRTLTLYIRDSGSVYRLVGQVQTKNFSHERSLVAIADEIGQTHALNLNSGLRSISIGLSGVVPISSATNIIGYNLLKQAAMGVSDDPLTFKLTSDDIRIDGTGFISSFSETGQVSGAILYSASLMLDTSPTIDLAPVGALDLGSCVVVPFAIAGGTADALTATFSELTLVDGAEVKVRAAFANATATPTLNANGGGAVIITRLGNQALRVADIDGAGHEMTLRYVIASPVRWELLNPAYAESMGKARIKHLQIRNWVVETPALFLNWQHVAYESTIGLYAACSTSGSGTNQIMTSPDGKTWTGRTHPTAASNQFTFMGAGGGRFLMIGDNAGAGERAMTSADGITWTKRTMPNDVRYVEAAYSPSLGRWCAVANTGTAAQMVATSDDNGATWTARTASVAQTWNSIDWSPDLSLFVAVASSGVGTRAMSSPDGITWTTRTSSADEAWKQVRWGNGRFVALSTGITPMISTNGTTWANATGRMDVIDWESLDFNGTFFVAVGDTGGAEVPRIQYSEDGHRWNHVWNTNPGSVVAFSGVACNRSTGDCVAVAANGSASPNVFRTLGDE